METVLLVLYLLIFIVQAVMLIFAIHRPTRLRWLLLFVLEVLPLASAGLIAWHFDTLPGFGIMPGLTYFAESIFSLAAAMAYGVMLLVSSLCGLVLLIRRKYSH